MQQFAMLDQDKKRDELFSFFIKVLRKIKEGSMCKMKGATVVSQLRNMVSSSSRSCTLTRSVLSEANGVYNNLVSFLQ
jgi:hypothetical protein